METIGDLAAERICDTMFAFCSRFPFSFCHSHFFVVSLVDFNEITMPQLKINYKFMSVSFRKQMNCYLVWCSLCACVGTHKIRM